jgi:hypothetical protein
MRIRPSILTTARGAALLIALSTVAACTHAGGKLMVDLPNSKVLPYQAPDIDEITGIDSSDDAAAPGAGSAQNPHR